MFILIRFLSEIFNNFDVPIFTCAYRVLEEMPLIIFLFFLCFAFIDK